jgi:hypothetical protein
VSAVTLELCASHRASSLPVDVSHIRMMSSLPALARTRPVERHRKREYLAGFVFPAAYLAPRFEVNKPDQTRAPSFRKQAWQ